MSTWDRLSMAERAEIMRIAVEGGVYDLDAIRNGYNEFAEGGDTNPGMTGMMKSKLAIAAHFGNPTARRMTNYDTRSYTWPGEYEYDNGIGELKRGNVFVGSYGNLVTPQIQDTGKGLTFVEDVWSPENDGRSFMQSLKFNNKEDAIYFGEHYKEIAPMMNLYNDGGHKIHIKPENRGKFTALKERTGHSASWFKQHGTPAQKKMATFALNARKWKHGLGGNLFLTGGPAQDDYPEGYWENRREHAEIRPSYKRTQKDKEYWKAKQESIDRAAEELNRKKGVIMSALEEQAESVPFTGKSYKQATDDQRQKALGKANDLKKGLKATITAAELGLSGASLLGAYANWRNWATAANLTKRGIANLLQKAQAPMQEAGALIDGYQTMDAYGNNDFDTYYNGASGILGVAGTIGASDIFRGRYPMVDRFLDTSGIIQNAGDFIKFGYDTLSNKAK